MTSYKLQINEEQLALIAEALSALEIQNLQRNSYVPVKLRVLKDLVTELPEKEAECPDWMHILYD